MIKFNKIKSYCLIFIASNFIAGSVLADVTGSGDISGDLNNFFNTLGYDGNANKPTSYQGQAAGYYSGGSMVLRNKVKNIQLMQIDFPDVRAGCGGIDLFMGGFSFVQAKKLTEFFQNIMNGASGYMFSLALETVVPEIAKAMHDIQKIAQEINASNFNSCEMAENLVGGMLPKMAAAQRHICKSAGNKNVFSDWAEARQECSDINGNKKGMDRANSDLTFKEQIILNKNLIWNAIAKINFLNSGGQEVKEFFMSLSGTIVFDTNGKAKIYPPLAKDQNMIKALLEGGRATIYKCDTDNCLNPYETEININKNHALYYKIHDSINQIVTALVSDQDKLPPKLQGFLELTKLPILKFITAHLMAGNAAMALSITSYSESIAKTLLMQYMHEALQVVEKSLSGTDYAPEIHKQLIDQIHQALIYVENIKTQSHHDIQELMSFVDSSKQTERETMSKVTGQLKNTVGGK